MIGGRWVPQVGTFADAPGQDLAALWDSSGWLALVVTGANAAEALELSVGTLVTVERPA
jgi:S-adenosylmethionine hydrolase